MDNAQVVRLATAFEAALLTPMLRPIAGSETGAASYFVGALARAIAASDGRGFAAALAARLETR